MAEKKPLDRYVEAGREFTEASRRCLEAIARDIAGEGGGRREHAEELLERGRRAAEQMGEMVRREVREQIKQFNLATNQDVVRLVQQFVERTTRAAAPVVDVASRTMTATKRAAGRGPAAKGTARPAPTAKKSPAAEEPAPKKAPAKRAAAARKPAPAQATAKKAAAKKAPAKKAAAKKAPAKKAAAKKAAGATKS